MGKVYRATDTQLDHDVAFTDMRLNGKALIKQETQWQD